MKDKNIVLIDKNETVMVEMPSGQYKKIPYEELIVAAGIKPNRSRRSKNPGRKFSRWVALTEHAVRTGTWTSGATIEIDKVVENLINSFEALKLDTEVPQITDVAIKKLTSIASSAKIGQSKPEVVSIIRAIMNAKGRPCA